MPGTPFAPSIAGFHSHSLIVIVGILYLSMEEGREMMFLVRTEVRGGNVDHLARKIVNREIPPVLGNIVYVTPDGRTGYNLVEAESENQARDMFSQYQGYVDVVEIVPIESMGQFIERWKAQHGITSQTKAA